MNICIHYCSQRLFKRSHSWHGEEISIVVHSPTFQKRWPIRGHRLLAELLAAKAKSRVLIYNAAITKLTLGTLARSILSTATAQNCSSGGPDSLHKRSTRACLPSLFTVHLPGEYIFLWRTLEKRSVFHLYLL